MAFDATSPATGHNTLDDVDAIRDNLNALRAFETSAEASPPASPVAGQFWFTSDTGKIYMRNVANTAWVLLFSASDTPATDSDLSTHAALDATATTVHGMHNSGASGNVDAKYLQGSTPAAFAASGHTHPGGDITSVVANATALQGYEPYVGEAPLTVVVRNASSVMVGTAEKAQQPVTPWVEAFIGAAAISQAKLKTSTGEVSASDSLAQDEYFYSLLALPGGEYGFLPRVRVGPDTDVRLWIDGPLGSASSYVNSTTAVTRLPIAVQNVKVGGVGRTCYGYASQRYVTSSGEVYWAFFLRNRETRAINSIWAAPDHPCFGNGNDPVVLPHPFANYNPETHEIIVATEEQYSDGTYGGEIGAILAAAGAGSFIETLTGGWDIDDESAPGWPEREVTVGIDSKGAHIMRAIPQPEGVFHRALRRKG